MSTLYNFRSIMKDLLMQQLYDKQIKYWDKALEKIAAKNALNHGRTERYNVYFNHKRYYPLILEWCDTPIAKNQFCLPMHPDFPEEIEDMREIATELDDLAEEKYETERFLSGLISFPAPPEVFSSILGDTLYSTIAEEIEGHTGYAAQLNPDEWNVRQAVSLESFMRDKNYIVQAMRQRILLNLITLD